MTSNIETERLTLGPFSDTDIDCLDRIANDIDVARMVAHMPHPYTQQDAIEWVTKHDTGRIAGTDFPFAITLKGDGLIGAVGFHKKGGALFDLGYWIGKPYWGHGYASEAAQAVMLWARKNLTLTEATACYFKDNPASVRILGFKLILMNGY